MGSKVSAGQSGGVSLLRQLGPFHFSLILNIFIHFFIFLIIWISIDKFVCLFIYSLNYFFLNFWYFFIHKLSWFPKVKLCVFECSFCSFTVRACLCVFVTYLHVCLHIPLCFVCSCCLFVQDWCMFVPMLVCTCVRLCVFVFVVSCECLCIKCQTTRALQQFQTIFKIFLSKEKVFY